MILRIGKIDKVYQWMTFHAILGVLTSFSKWFIIVWFTWLSIQSMVRLLSSRDKNAEVMYLLAYIVGIEILFRMAKTSPFIPYEIGKYGPILFISTALIIARQRTSTAIGFLIILMLLPSLLVYYGSKYLDDVVFNFFGMFTLGLSVQYFNRRIIYQDQFINLVRTALMPLISILAYLTIRTPSFDEIDFKLGALFETTGGFGSNQVSTVLGVALFLLAVCYFNRFVIFGSRTVDLAIMAYILVRALLTFSRGGIVVSVLVIVIYILMIRPSGFRLPGLKTGQLLFFTSVLIAGTMLVNRITNDALLLRYEGETQTTLSGEKEKDINVITTGRYELFISELELFARYPIMGVGPGGAMYLRDHEDQRIASHSEFSRLPAENGIFGVIIIIILLMYPAYHYSKKARDPGKIVSICLTMIALGMTFHAAMRTFVTPFLYGLGLASIYFKKNEVQHS